jgi:predicted enzyme related to lactoylglutathione lyase
MKISYSKIYVDDQDKALKFYTDTLGFVKKKDVTNGDYRWLTVVSPDVQDGPELILELNANPAAKTYQEAVRGQSLPAALFDTADVHAEHARLSKHGVKFTTEPYEVMPHVTVAIFDDTVGNLVQIQRVGE